MDMGATFIWVSYLVLLSTLHGGFCEQPINVTFGDVTQVVMFERHQVTVNVSVVSYEGSDVISVFFESEDAYTFEVMNKSFARFEVASENNFPVTFPVTLKGKHIGISDLLVMAEVAGSDRSEQVASLVVKINVGNNIIQGILKYVFYAPLLCVFFMMGTTMDFKAIADCFKHPMPIFIGFICQFVLMPALSLGIGKLFRLDDSYALGLLLMGCSPGGKISNDLTVLLNGDYVLSVTMTACSTTLALVMMPLNMFIYLRFLTDSDIKTPFAQIAIQIGILLTPVLLGILLNYKFPMVKEKVVKVLKPIVLIMMLIGVGMVVPFAWYIFLSPQTVYTAAFLLPLFGTILGGLISKLLQLPNKKVIAISMETGVQNGLFATVVLKSVYPSPEADLARSAPSLSFMSMALIGLSIVISRFVYNRCVSRKDGDDTDGIIKNQIAVDHVTREDHNSKDVILTSVNTDISDHEEVFTGNNNAMDNQSNACEASDSDGGIN